MSADVESMAYRFETEADSVWHGIGAKVDPNTEPDDMLIAAELNWDVLKRPLSTSLEGFEEMLLVEDFFSLVRSTDRKVLGICGKDYVPTQNRQAFAFFKQFCKSANITMETAGSLAGGKYVFVLARINRDLILPGGDVVKGYLLLLSPHIWGKSFLIKFCATRVVCRNTLMLALKEKSKRSFRMPHVRAFDAEVQKEAAQTMGIAMELFDGFEATANLLAQTKVDADVVVRYVADILEKEKILEQFGKGFYKLPELKQAELLMDPSSPRVNATQFGRSASDVLSAVNRQPGADLLSSSGTLWGAFNATTYWADHLAGRDRDLATQSAWFGPRSVIKTAALTRAAQMAQVAGVK